MSIIKLTHKSCDNHRENNNYSQYFDKIVLTEDEEYNLIKDYSDREKTIKVKQNCSIGVGYTTCMDINFRAVDMF